MVNTAKVMTMIEDTRLLCSVLRQNKDLLMFAAIGKGISDACYNNERSYECLYKLMLPMELHAINETQYCQLASAAICTKIGVLQFWTTTKVKTINKEAQIHAKVDGKKVIISEASIRRDLLFGDEGGVDCLPNEAIFEQLTLIGHEKVLQKLNSYKAFFSPKWKFLIYIILQCLSAKTTSWNEFSSTMASAIICLATNQKFNFSKYISESMVKNLDSVTKFFMYPRFVKVFLNNQLEEMANHTRIYVPPSYTKKIFRNMKMVGKSFSRPETPLFPTMMVQPQEEMGEEFVVDKAINKEMNDSLERDATTATSLDAKQDRGSGPKRQDTVEDAVAHSRSERVSKISNDPLLVGVNTPQSEKDSQKLNELVDLCTNLQNMVLALEATKTTQALEIDSLKRRVKKLEKKKRSRTYKLKRLYKVKVQEKDKGIMVELEKPIKKKDQTSHDEELALNLQDELQAEFDNEQRLAEERAQQEQKANVTLTKTWEDIQAKIDADYQLAERLQAEEQEALTDEEKAKLFVEFLEKRIKLFAAKRAEEKRNKPPIKAQQRSIMSTYLKNMEGYKLKSLKNKSFAHIQKLFDKAMKRVNTFVDYKTEMVVKESSKKAKAEITHEDSSKRSGDELEQERSKKQKMEDDKKSEELKKCLEIILDDRDDVTIDATPLSSKSPTIIGYKIYEDGKKSYF
nr:hypothetical protein [Tanacetum cinerariifolium]